MVTEPNVSVDDLRISELEKGICDVYESLKAHDIDGAKRRLLSLGAIPKGS